MDLGFLGSGFFSLLYNYLPPFLVVLGCVVFFHELGHFSVARWLGVKISVFSIGFGPELFGWWDKRGVRWRFSWIPLGGYVAFTPEHSDSRSVFDQTFEPRLAPPVSARWGGDKGVSFNSAPLYARAAIVVAGPVANFILSFLLLSAVFFTVGRPSLSPRIDFVFEGTPAFEAGLLPGDVVQSINGRSVERFHQIQVIAQSGGLQPLLFLVERDGRELSFRIVPRYSEVKDRFGAKQERFYIGIGHEERVGERIFVRYGLPGACLESAKELWFATGAFVSSLATLVRGEGSMDQLGGPLRIAQVSKHAADSGLFPLIQLMALLSLSIGLLNLLPLPMLDGGHLLFYFLEMVRGEPLSPEFQERLFQIGAVLLFLCMILVTWSDISYFESLVH